jgi:hypothetical protein
VRGFGIPPGALKKIVQSVIPDIALDVVGSLSQYRHEHGIISAN